MEKRIEKLEFTVSVMFFVLVGMMCYGLYAVSNDAVWKYDSVAMFVLLAVYFIIRWVKSSRLEKTQKLSIKSGKPS